MTSYSLLDSPIGRLLLVAEDGQLSRIDFPPAAEEAIASHWRHQPADFDEANRQLTAYFAGQRQEFDLPLHLVGTPFQRLVWQELTRIPYGQTASYGEIARRIDRSKACRAVGMANHRNPLPIIIPCHRVIGADGSLTGFGGGLACKQFLLDLERHHLSS